MLDRIFPASFDNTYRGRKIALWFFYLLTVMTVVRSCIHIFKDDGGAQSIATIPLDTYTNGGAEGIVMLFAYWGLSQLLLGLVYVVVCLRYKSMVPLMYLTLILEYSGRFLISLAKPIETVGQAPGGVGNMVFPFLCLVLLLLSVNQPKK